METTSTFSGRTDVSLAAGEPMVASTAAAVVTEADECTGEPAILEEIEVEELAVDGICGVY